MSTFIKDEALLQQIEWEGGGRHPSNEIVLPKDMHDNLLVYDIDVRTRIIDAPKLLGVKDDHQAERVFFRIDRIVNNIDLSTLMAIVQYKNSQKESFIYVVPYVDIFSELTYRGFTQEQQKNQIPKMLVPWNIKGTATSCPGPIEFALKFYKTTPKPIDQLDGKSCLLYEFNTQIARSQIMNGMGSIANIDLDNNKTFVEVGDFYTKLEQIKKDKEGVFQLYWTHAADGATKYW